MSKQKNVSNLLIGNVQITYFRMMTTIFLGVFTTRLVFRELGEIQFGVFSVVGASIFFITSIQSTLTASTQRHLAFEIGKNDRDEASRVFSTSLLLAVTVAAVVFFGGFLVSAPAVQLLQVPEELMGPALTTLRYTIATAAVLIIASPFTATLSANQNFLFPAIVAFILSLGSLIAAYSLRFLPGNSLENYSGLRFLVITLTTAATVGFALINFSESRFSTRRIKRRLVKPLVAFGGWAGLATFSWRLRFQGIQLLGNAIFGPTFNAALGVAQQLYGYANSLPAAVINVIRPTLTQMVGREDRRRSINLLQISTRICPILGFFLVGPLLIEMEFVLTKWLDDPPVGAGMFTFILMINLLLDHMTSGHAVFFHARGEIKWYSLFVFLNVVAQLALAYFATKAFELPAYSILLFVLLGTLVNVAYKVLFAVPDMQAKEAIRGWFTTCFFPVLVPCLIAAGSGILVTLAFPTPGWVRLGTVVVVHSAVLALAAWNLGLQPLEKEKLQYYLKRFLRIGKNKQKDNH